jgi:transcriptional regulator with XRE-family HTH domain
MQRKKIGTMGDVIKSARQSMGMTQKQLAESLCITPRYLKAIENSGRKPSHSLFVRIVEAIGIQAYVISQSESKELYEKMYIFNGNASIG